MDSLDDLSDDVIQNVCRILQEEGSYLALSALIQSSRRTQTLCQSYLKPFRCVVSLYEYNDDYGGATLYWLLEIHLEDYLPLQQEFNSYNEDIVMLFEGNAPDASYQDETKNLLKERSYHEHASFTLYPVIPDPEIKTEDEDEDEATEMTESQLKKLTLGETYDLRNFLEGRFSLNSHVNEGFGLTMLPVTKRILDRYKKQEIKRYQKQSQQKSSK